MWRVKWQSYELSVVTGELKRSDDSRKLYKSNFKHLAAHAQHLLLLTRHSFIPCMYYLAFSSHFIDCAWRAFDFLKHLFHVLIDLLYDGVAALVLSCLISLFLVRVVVQVVQPFISFTVKCSCRPVMCSLKDVLLWFLPAQVLAVSRTAVKFVKFLLFLVIVSVGHAPRDVEEDFLVRCLQF